MYLLCFFSSLTQSKVISSLSLNAVRVNASKLQTVYTLTWFKQIKWLCRSRKKPPEENGCLEELLICCQTHVASLSHTFLVTVIGTPTKHWRPLFISRCWVKHPRPCHSTVMHLLRTPGSPPPHHLWMALPIFSAFHIILGVCRVNKITHITWCS